MRTLKQVIFCLVLNALFTATYGQTEKTEKEYLTNLADAFVKKDIVVKPGNLFWSKCLGEENELAPAELNKRIESLISNNNKKVSFYKKLNYYMSSVVNYYSDLLELRKVVPLTPAIKTMIDKGEGNYNSYNKTEATSPIIAFDELKAYFEYVAAFGEDTSMQVLCTPQASPISSDTSSKSTDTGIFIFVEQVPEFPGGDAALIKFLQQNIIYPRMERDNDIQGKVILRFVVCPDGKVSQIEVTRAVSVNLDAEAARVVKMMPAFKPGKQQGKAVMVYFNIPVVYKLQ